MNPRETTSANSIAETIVAVLPGLPEKDQVYILGYMAGIAAAHAIREETTRPRRTGPGKGGNYEYLYKKG